MPTLLEDINAASDWIVGALNYSGYKVSMDLESLREVDRFFNEHMNDRKHKPKKGGLLADNTGTRLFALGSFIGNVLISQYGGWWITDDADPEGEINIAVQLQNGVLLWPVQRVMKRCGEGPENGIYAYGAIAGCQNH